MNEGGALGDKTVFIVPTDRQSVTVRLSTGVMLEGEIFMESLSEGLSMHQKLSAFIENNNTFFPIKVTPGGNTQFINKTKIQLVEVSLPGDPETSYFAHLPMQNIPVTVYFNNGNSVSGELMAEVPQEKARLSDCLNLTEKFLKVKSGKKMCYINKEALQKVVHAVKS